MDFHRSNIAHVLAITLAGARAAAVEVWRTAISWGSQRYQPAAHYMRGPGPKWRAEHPEEWRARNREGFTRP
jgi:hypothetical protein